MSPQNWGAGQGLFLDGKTLRGSARQGAADAHLLRAFSHRHGVVLGQAGVPDKTNEIGAASGFLLTLVLEGRVVTADALLTPREFARTILDSGGDYLLAVKEYRETAERGRWPHAAPGPRRAGVTPRRADAPACGPLTAGTHRVLPRGEGRRRKQLSARTTVPRRRPGGAGGRHAAVCCPSCANREGG